MQGQESVPEPTQSCITEQSEASQEQDQPYTAKAEYRSNVITGSTHEGHLCRPSCLAPGIPSGIVAPPAVLSEAN